MRKIKRLPVKNTLREKPDSVLEKAVGAIKQANDEFACGGSVPFRLAVKSLVKSGVVESYRDGVRLIEKLNKMKVVRIEEDFDDYMNLVRYVLI